MTKRAENNLHKVTYFERDKHQFLTRKWYSDVGTDKRHWCQLHCFCRYVSDFTLDEFDYTFLQASDQVFMRWKETKSKDNLGFVAPGFYYVCLTMSSGNCVKEYIINTVVQYGKRTFNNITSNVLLTKTYTSSSSKVTVEF